MSRIYFHSPSEDDEVSGRERHNIGYLCSSLLIASMEPLQNIVEELEILDSSWDEDAPVKEADILALKLKVGSHITINGEKIEIFGLSLSTAWLVGSDAIKLAARFHAQCEIHCFVEGKNRQWLADLIKTGRRLKIFRSDCGWESVIAMLERRDDEPVVCSYSVCDSFPGIDCLGDHPLAKIDSEKEEYPFYDLSDQEQWEVCMKAIRSQPSLEIKPQDWDNDFFFGEKTGFSIRNIQQ